MKKIILLPLLAFLTACDRNSERKCEPDVRVDNIERIIMHGSNSFTVLYRRAPPEGKRLYTHTFGWGEDVELYDDVVSDQPLWFERKLTRKDDWSCRYQVTIHLHNPQEVH